MSSFSTSLVVVASLCCGGLVGSWLRDRLPDHHVRDDSKDVVKNASGMIATLAALVLGLLVSSAKSVLDQANEGITEMGAKAILLDRTLARYGDEGQVIRDKLVVVLKAGIERLWPEHGMAGGLASVEKGTGLDQMQEMLEHLEPDDEVHRTLKNQALLTCGELVNSRWLLIERGTSRLPTPFLVVMILWLTVLFTSFGLLAPRNVTTVSCLFVCAVSMAGAILLILEMSNPFEGLMQVSPAPLLKALSLMER